LHHPSWQQLGFATNARVAQRSANDILDWLACYRMALAKRDGKKFAREKATLRKKQIIFLRGGSL
jgi:hypothetical protein